MESSLSGISLCLPLRTVDLGELDAPPHFGSSEVGSTCRVGCCVFRFDTDSPIARNMTEVCQHEHACHAVVLCQAVTLRQFFHLLLRQVQALVNSDAASTIAIFLRRRGACC